MKRDFIIGNTTPLRFIYKDKSTLITCGSYAAQRGGSRKGVQAQQVKQLYNINPLTATVDVATKPKSRFCIR